MKMTVIASETKQSRENGCHCERSEAIPFKIMKTKKPAILIFGKNGQIGWELCRTMAPLGTIVGMDYPEIDLAEPDSICSAVRSVKPDIIVNAAAYTAVDKAESEPELAMAVNGTAPGIIAEEAGRIGAVLIHYSTDYVYNGEKRIPYVETDAANPLNVYGKTKLAGDLAVQSAGVTHLIFRTSWVYGRHGNNFLMTMLNLAREREEIKVVDDQIGAPTWSREIAEAAAQIVSRGIKDLKSFFAGHGGIYHMSAGGCGSWFDFAKGIFECDPNRRGHKLRRLLPISTKEFNSAAVRPAYSVLNNEKFFNTFGFRLADWQRQLQMCFTTLISNL
jgi:dTDP-4-dehydrorhamnose reductase